MVRVLLILLIMLLPLRGWSAERMSTQMAYGPATVQVAEMQSSAAVMPVDCPMVAQAATANGKTSAPSKSQCGCQTCQFCMALGSTQKVADLVWIQRPGAPSIFFSTDFSSAELARQAKPPILKS